MIPGLELVPLEESEICCGAAGTYNLTQPEMSERLGRRKMDHIEATGAEVVATGNVGCILQIARKIKERGRPIEVVHPVDLLDRAYRGASEDESLSGSPSEASGGRQPAVHRAGGEREDSGLTPAARLRGQTSASSAGADLLRGPIGVLGEVLAEQARELAGRLVVGRRVGPGLSRDEQMLGGYAGARRRDLEAEDRILAGRSRRPVSRRGSRR